MFSFVRNHQTAFPSDCTVFHSHQHRVRVPVASQPNLKTVILDKYNRGETLDPGPHLQRIGMREVKTTHHQTKPCIRAVAFIRKRSLVFGESVMPILAVMLQKQDTLNKSCYISVMVKNCEVILQSFFDITEIQVLKS